MARYTGSVCRLCRRENLKLFLKGDRCYSDKCAFDRRSYAPGQHGQGRRRKESEYSVQLRAKQKLARIYGVREGQFRSYYGEATRIPGVSGENLLRLLESRLDSLVFRLGFAPSRKAARQLVRHNHFTVNGKRVNVPSYMVKQGDEISPSERKLNKVPIKEALENMKNKTLPHWLVFDIESKKGLVQSLPTREDVSIPVEEQLIVEHYSR